MKTLLKVVASSVTVGCMIGLCIAHSGWWILGIAWSVAIFVAWMTDEMRNSIEVEGIDI